MVWNCVTLFFPSSQTMYEWIWNSDKVMLTGEIRKTRTETCPIVSFSATNPTWPAVGANPGLRCKKPAANSLWHCSAVSLMLEFVLFGQCRWTRHCLACFTTSFSILKCVALLKQRSAWVSISRYNCAMVATLCQSTVLTLASQHCVTVTVVSVVSCKTYWPDCLRSRFQIIYLCVWPCGRMYLPTA
jgi:hypothetical protein